MKKTKIVSKSKEYDAIHSWIRYRYGKALFCSNKDCKGTSKSYEWALIKGFEYERNIQNYKPLCAPCHRRYDQTEEMKEKIRKQWKEGLYKNTGHYENKNRKFKEVDMLSIEGKYIKTFHRVEEAAKEVGIHASGITFAIRKGNSHKRAGGYRWRAHCNKIPLFCSLSR